MFPCITLLLKTRKCFNCKSKDTRNGLWYRNKDNEGTHICAKCYDHKRRFKDFKNKLNQRICSNCDSNETLISINRYGYEYKRWTSDGKGGWLCNRCYNHIKYGPNRYIHNERQIQINGKRISLKYNPRIGICSKCNKSVKKGEIEFTCMYCEDKSLTIDNINLDNVREYLTELCPSCMNIILHSNGVMKSRWENHQYKMDRFLHARQRYYSTPEWLEIRKQVLKKYDSSCINCGRKRQDNIKTKEPKLHIHHIEPWATHPELRFKPDNLVPLCERCHRNKQRKKEKI